MFIASGWKDYEVIDTGDGEKLERWQDVILRRPDPQAIWPKQKGVYTGRVEFGNQDNLYGSINVVSRMTTRWDSHTFKQTLHRARQTSTAQPQLLCKPTRYPGDLLLICRLQPLRILP